MTALPLNVVAVHNQREFDVKLKWNLQYRPEGETAASFHDIFSGDDRKKSHLAQQEGHASRSRRHRNAIAESAAAGLVKSSKEDATVPKTASGAASSGPRKAHVRRKHRGDCPKHLLHEMLRQGLEPAPEEVPLVSRSAASTDRLPVPHMVGKGIGALLNGVSHPKYDSAHYELRGKSEMPNYAQARRMLDETVEREGPSYRASQVHHAAPAWLMEEPLVVDTSLNAKLHNRPKYELKSHMEAVRMMGKALLREFSGAAFK
eukprot:CAMPEP_0176412172 /NCGR_PEP_ID=MMETSP0127-20121128/3999_1 /TAXON_ID=938130 /ORGANISM="Platyophrya macrostoma, Strain WH" /LENGTH=260 /DNA_ID=CAMNT_0017791819 /DNA_START=120 /DNA_END=902 /DNA_ORIENTATION=-